MFVVYEPAIVDETTDDNDSDENKHWVIYGNSTVSNFKNDNRGVSMRFSRTASVNSLPWAGYKIWVECFLQNHSFFYIMTVLENQWYNGTL